ncbi:hypothetical protein JQM66_09995 [Oscillibacter valericigenes]|uniref:hypothetical protein n=1 Tax=Oscillibacter valericigenes TaxID=351091 RepID=UPI001F26E273|nr:hypothetical protein [Oscillibacter valericigenes]MCF2664884.1 hypothetical protein [Oscillibacter valericigenes]
MKTRNLIYLLALCLVLLTGCGAKQPESPAEEQEPPAAEQPEAPVEQETPAEEPEAPESETAALPDALPLDLMFASGAGAWSTDLTLERDGSFAGVYHDSEMGDQGEGYPNGSCYISTFSGRFGSIRQVDDHTWAMTLEELTVQEEPDTEWIEDGIRYTASEAYGLETGKEFLLYSPETPTEGLDEEFLIWWPSWNVEDTGTLNCWGLLNQETGYGFFTY